MTTLRKLEKSGKSIPAWICETHLREIDDLETSGEHSEAAEVLKDGLAEWPVWCPQCLDNKHPFTTCPRCKGTKGNHNSLICLLNQ